MTVRRSHRGPRSPEEIAAAVPGVALTAFEQTTDYRAFSQALTEEVEEIAGQDDHVLAMRVADALGASVVDWAKARL